MKYFNYKIILAPIFILALSFLNAQKIVHLEGSYDLDGDNLLGRDGEAATDGSHPNDLGMIRYADAYEPVLRSILRQF